MVKLREKGQDGPFWEIEIDQSRKVPGAAQRTKTFQGNEGQR